MNQDQIETYRQRLLSLHQEIEELEATGRSAADTVELDQSRVGRLSRMDALQGQQMAQETARRRQLQLQKIKIALKRLDAGDYGYCLECGEEIPAGRLDFDPASARCIGCMAD